MKRTALPLPLFSLLTLLLLASLACAALTKPITREPQADQDTLIEAAVATVQAQMGQPVDQPISGQQMVITVDSDLQETLTNLYNRVNPSVVFILTYVGETTLGSGSGFVYDEQGHIITNNHVVAEGDNYEIIFANGTHRRATLVGTDIDSDLAVLRVDDLPEMARPVPLAAASDIQVGQFVVAIGSPFGQQGSMSLGIVSGLGRSLESQRDIGVGLSYSLPRVIQTDAPINPGNSGGPLLNLNGEVLGVNNAIRTLTGVNSGVGFAIPVDAIHRIVPVLITEGEYIYPFMGIQSLGRQLTIGEQEQLRLPQVDGVYVTFVTEDSPADRAGLRAAGSDNLGGDLIIAIDGQDVNEFNDLISYLVFETEVGQTIMLTVIRDGETIELPLTLGERP